MPVDTSTIGSPGWWLVRLASQLNDDRPRIERLDRYLRGDHPMPELQTREDRENFAEFLRTARSNFLALVAEAPVERMRVVGFRAGANDKVGDDASMRIWSAAHLDADQSLVHRAMIALSRVPVMVGPHPRKRGRVLITVEDPRYVITESYPDDRREIAAGLKVWSDLDGFARATVFLPDRVVRFKSPSPVPAGGLTYTSDSFASWVVSEDVRNRLGVVPIVSFENRASVTSPPMSEFEDVIDIQNRVNSTLLHRLVAEKYGAFRKLAILNYALEEDEDGKPIAPALPSHPGVAWLLDGENVRMWESQQTSTSDILAGIEADIRHLASITRTPSHYLLSGLSNVSGDTLKAAETGLVAKVRERLGQAGEGWETVIRLGHLVLGDTARASEDSPLTVVWADPESRTLAELSDAAVKQMAAGTTWRDRMVLLGKTPAEIDRMEAERMQDALVASLAAPAAPVALGQVPARAVTDAPEVVAEPE